MLIGRDKTVYLRAGFSSAHYVFLSPQLTSLWTSRISEFFCNLY